MLDWDRVEGDLYAVFVEILKGELFDMVLNNRRRRYSRLAECPPMVHNADRSRPYG